MPHIISTLTNNNTYATYRKGGGDIPIVDKKVTIAGGANVAGKHLVTPQGVVTSVTNEELEFLKGHQNFQNHMKRGFVKIAKSSVSDPNKAAAGMEARDESAPITPDDYGDDHKGAKPMTGKAERRF